MKKRILTLAPLFCVLLLASCDGSSITTPSSDNDRTSIDSESSNTDSNVSDQTSDNIEDTTNSSSDTGKDLPGINSTFKSKVEEDVEKGVYLTSITIKDNDTNKIYTKSIVDPLDNPYLEIDTDKEKEEFYNDYTIAKSPIDAKYRSEAGLLSGSNFDSDYLPHSSINMEESTLKISNSRSNTLNYLINEDTNEKEAYIFYSLDGSFNYIYKSGAYWTINDTAAYLLAFGNCPINQDYDKYEAQMSLSTDTWYRYGRVNRGFYDGPVKDKYAYESWFVGMEDKDIYYTETDFGNATYYNKTEYDSQYAAMPYIKKDETTNEYDIYTATPGDRGVLRFCFTSEFENLNPANHNKSHATPKTKENFENSYYKRVYYTFNHYNDWHEFLNYKDGWSDVFGNMTRGNDYNDMNIHKDKSYAPIPKDNNMNEIIRLWNN